MTPDPVPLEPLMLDLPEVEGRPAMPAGFRAAAGSARIKDSGRPDLGLLSVTTGQPASVGATFTTNLLRAAPVEQSKAYLARSAPLGEGRWGYARAMLSTSGSANAATGADGERDQELLAEALGTALGVDPAATLAISTGLIGTRLPVERIRTALPALVKRLDTTDAALAALGEQMMTTDSRPKAATVRLELPAADGTPLAVTLSGVAKGVGMIHPRMATMLSVLLTDARVEPATLYSLLQPAVERTWNQLTVDADTSTNDTVFLLASSASGSASVEMGTPQAERLGRAIHAVARALARQQAADGEGATTLITCQVSGARDDPQARAVARAVVASNLVKAAVHGRDPNWGRMCAAAGNAQLDGRPVELSAARLHIALCGFDVFRGEPLAFDRASAARSMDAPEVLLRIDLGLGDGSGEAFGCDLSEQYVVENSAYST
ncbi:bifunctional glutamate N-acetyltransferase/amino-acid acetyltransferase ArgJ [soil metagenome]